MCDPIKGGGGKSIGTMEKKYRPRSQTSVTQGPALLAALSKSDPSEERGGSGTPARAAAFWRQQGGHLAGSRALVVLCKVGSGRKHL